MHRHPSTDTEGQRQFKWLLSLNIDSKIEGSKVGENGGKGGWKIEKTTWQGVDVSRWKELSATNSRNIYKLVFKKEWNQNENEISNKKSVRGAVGLVKVSWERNGYERTAQELIGRQVKTQDTSKVWLIIAKGEKSIYLIPVVRSSALWTDYEVGEKMRKNEDTEKVWTEGVKDLREWATTYDKSQEWKIPRNAQLQKSLESGFSIMRGGDVFWAKNGGLAEKKVKRTEISKWLGKEESERKNGFLKEVKRAYLHQNAGILEGRGKSESCGECKQAEKYFPLDIAVLGDQTKLRNLSDWYGNLIQEIEVKDTITQVIGVSLN